MMNRLLTTATTLSALLLLQITTIPSSSLVHSFTSWTNTNAVSIQTRRYSKNNNDDDDDTNNPRRRQLLQSTLSFGTLLTTTVNPSAAYASSSKSRTEGYAVQRTEREWAYILSGPQYNILRMGGTERPNSSILESEDRDGTFVCAGCNTPLFSSAEKFHSGTGWPSFAMGIDNNVQVEKVNPVQASIAGAELRCATCGGHLGDVFQDGFLFVGTPAAKSGKRYCIDGAALVFKPSGGGEDVFGDVPPPRTSGGGGGGGDLPGFLQPPKIVPRSS